MVSDQLNNDPSELTIQQQLLNSITELYPDAEAKKLDKDNFLDIYIPSVSIGKGTHLFFNTVKGSIKIGYYTRDKDFIYLVSSRAPQQIDAASNGLRIVGNPKFDNKEAAVAAALVFLSAIQGEGIVSAQSPAVGLAISSDLSAEVMSQEEMDAFIAENGVDTFSEALEIFLIDGEIVVLTIEKEDLIAVISGTSDAGDCIQPLGTVELNNWNSLATIVGKKEANWAKKEFKEENASGIVLLYCDGKYVYAFSNPQEVNSTHDDINSLDNDVISEDSKSTKLDKDSIPKILEALNSDKNLTQISITYYTRSYSDLNYSLTYKLKKSIIEVNRVNWFNDSYWTGQIERKELIKGLKSYFRGQIDTFELVEDYFSRDLIDYEFKEAGNFDNGVELEITDLGGLTEVPENLQDEEGNLDVFELSNYVVVQEEDLYDTNMGEVLSYQISINGKTYELIADQLEEDSSTKDEEIDGSESEDGIDDEEYEEEEEEEEENIIKNTHPTTHYSDLEKLIKIIKDDCQQIHFANEALLTSETNLKALILANPEIFELLPEKLTSSKSIRKIAIENGYLDSNFMEVIDVKDKALLRKVVTANSNYYRYLPDEDRTKELTFISIENQSCDITFDILPIVIQNDPTFFKELLTYLNTHLSYKPIPGYTYCDSLLQGYKKWILDDAEVIIKNSLLGYASKRLIKDESFCFNYLKENKESYGYLLRKNKTLENNETFARLAVELDGASNYPELPDRFKHNREFLKIALKSAEGNLMLNQLPNEVILVNGKIDFDLVVDLIKVNPHNITTISIQMMESEGVAEKLIFAAKDKNNILYYAPASLKKDKVFLSKLTNANPFTIAFADKSILADREFMRGILSKLPIAIKFCAEELKADKELVKEVVGLNGLVVRYLDEKIVSDPEIYWTALHQNPEAYNLLPFDIYTDKTVIDYISKINGGIFTYYSSTPYTKEVRFNAILNSADGAFKEELQIFKSIEENSNPMDILEAVKIDHTQVVFLPEEFFSKNLEITRAILAITFFPLRYKSCRMALGEQEIKKHLKSHPWALKFLDEDESFSEEFVKEMLAINGNLLQYLSEDQKKDSALIRIALNTNPEACYFVSKEYDWKSEEAQEIAKQILTINPLLFSYFIERDPAPIYEFFMHAFSLDASVLEKMDHSFFEDAWYFVSDINGSFQLDEDPLLYGLNQNGKFYYFDPISNNVTNVCLAIENGLEFDWENLFATWEYNVPILEKAFTYFPSEITFQTLKKVLGKKFDENIYVTPQVVSKGAELYPLISDKLKQDKKMAFAYLKSDDYYDLATKFDNLPNTFKKDAIFLRMISEIKIDFEILDGFFDSKLLYEESFILPYLSINFEQYSYFPEKLQKNKNVALRYGVNNSAEEYYGLTDLALPDSLAQDKTLILEIAKGNKFRTFGIDNTLLNDTKFLLELIEFQPQLVKSLEEENRSQDLLYKLIDTNLDVFDYLEDEEKLNSKFFNLVATKNPSKIRKIEWSYTMADVLSEHSENLSIRSFINLFEESDFAEALNEQYAFESVIINIQNENESHAATQYYIKEPGEITLGYNRDCYLSEDAAGEIPDQTILEYLETEDDWSNFIWYKSWNDFSSIYHSHGMVEPATDMKLPNGSITEISLTYNSPSIDKMEECFTNSKKGSFVHIASSNEKAYGWGKWKTYSMAVTPGVFDVANISVEFEEDIVSSYRYKLPEGPYNYFEESQDYETTGQGFSSTLYFNNGKELIDMDELRDLLEEKEVSIKDIKAIKKNLLTYDV